MSEILSRVDGPADIKSLNTDELQDLADEVREMIINTVSRTGGHLAANLGVVELTVALLKVFSPPDDKLIWDVGHQTYTYKILTGRRDQFGTLRQFGGISGFQKRKESDYDAFGAGHSGTAVSSALGMAVARDMRKSNEHVIAILGDGSAGCGISLEAFNNVEGTTGRLIVVLNDNEMSIAANVGSMSSYLGRLLASPRYNRWKRSVESVASRLKMGLLRSAYYRIEEAIKSLFLRSVLFEEFGLRYIGPIDGHDIHSLVDALRIASESDKPIILHVSTEKGRGYKFAEEHPEKWHGTPSFNVATGEQSGDSEVRSYSSVFGATLERLAAMNERIVAITAAMPAGTGLTQFAAKYPRRFFDVGISEEHAVVFAAGLAAEGMIPVFVVYSTFAQRVIDYMIHDVCLQGLPVVLCLDRAGVVGDDGPTHHGVFDIALLRPIPDLVIMQPRDVSELPNMLYTATRMGKPVVIRYPRGGSKGVAIADELEEIPEGKAQVMRNPGETSAPVWIWALGDMIPVAMATADLLAEKGMGTGVVNARFISPVDESLITEQSKSARAFVTLENGIVKGGFGCGLEECLREGGCTTRVHKFGWPDSFIPQGSLEVLMQEYGLTPQAIADKIGNVQ